MKKLLIPAFACTAAMLIACGDDSSSASSDVPESSSSVAAESSSSNWDHENVGADFCISASDSTTLLRYVYEGPDSAMEVICYVYPKMFEDVEKVCEEAKANKTDDQEVTCEDDVEISYQPKTMTFESLKALMTEECYKGTIKNEVDSTNPDEAPENIKVDNSKSICKYYPENAGCHR